MSKESADAALGKFAEAVNTGKFDVFDQVVASTASTTIPPTDRSPAPPAIECSSLECARPSPT